MTKGIIMPRSILPLGGMEFRNRLAIGLFAAVGMLQAQVTHVLLYTVNGVGYGDNLAESVSGAGDVNGDGFDVIVVATHFSFYCYWKLSPCAVGTRDSLTQGPDATTKPQVKQHFGPINSYSLRTVYFANASWKNWFTCCEATVQL